MKLARLVACSMALAVAGCSPYVYKQEIDGFATGVKDLATAYNDGRAYVATRDLEDLDARWTQARVPLTIAACEFRDKGDPGTVECVLHQVAQPVPGPSPLGVAVRDAAPIVRALSDYSTALAAVTNAADCEALLAAQTKLKTAVQALVTAAAGSASPVVGPVLEIAGTLIKAVCDHQRYAILRSAVLQAQAPVATLGNTLGLTLGGIWMVRANELRDLANVEVRNLGTGTDYAARLKRAREKVTTLETLRSKNPAQAATDMVAAHNALAKALADDSRQIEAVSTAVGTFATQAKAVKDAFAK